jgi:hypothetical protein
MVGEPPKKIMKGKPAEQGEPPKQPDPFLPSVEHLLFRAPLYARFSLNDDLRDVKVLYGRVEDAGGRHVVTKIDGYCPQCQRDSTFRVDAISIPSGDPWNNIKKRAVFERMSITCSRNEGHYVLYYFVVKAMTIMKVGQFPSLADIAIDETRQKYRSVLKGPNWAELYKAIGLAAHGEGIGSFVYLRRVFERLIQSRFDEFKIEEGWKDTDFDRLHMDEKVAFLKDHLPPYLVQIRKIYSIFSLGIHELDNHTCLQFFDVGKRSIIVILEDDLKKQEELIARKELADAIAKFSPKQGQQET